MLVYVLVDILAWGRGVPKGIKTKLIEVDYKIPEVF
jgi:hypothetical protein